MKVETTIVEEIQEDTRIPKQILKWTPTESGKEEDKGRHGPAE